ncbi:MAG: hypothetical protein HZC01_03730 [Candidatus Kerfeldbacteria bacterium]|nr:hypothetical protein [Candidatus Kerfeldbacteria bacterium]
MFNRKKKEQAAELKAPAAASAPVEVQSASPTSQQAAVPEKEEKVEEGFFSSIGSFFGKLGDLFNETKGLRTVEHLFAVYGAFEAFKKKHTIWGHFINLLSMIAVGVDKFLDPTKSFLTAVFVRYMRAVRLALPVMVLCFLSALIIPLAGFTGQSVWMMGLYSALIMLFLSIFVDYTFIASIDRPSAPNSSQNTIPESALILSAAEREARDRACREAMVSAERRESRRRRRSAIMRRILGHSGIFIGSWLFIPTLSYMVGGVEPTTLVLSAPFLLILSFLALIVFLPLLGIAYILMRFANKGKTPPFLESVYNPLFVLFFFVGGATITFEMLQVWHLPGWMFIGSIIALLVLGVAAIRKTWIRTFLQNTTVVNAFLKLGIVATLCVICIAIPDSGNQQLLFRTAQDWLGNGAREVAQSNVTRPGGDVIFDHKVDSCDLEVVKKIVNKSTKVSSIDSAYADVNQDGVVNDIDVVFFEKALKEGTTLMLRRPTSVQFVAKNEVDDEQSESSIPPSPVNPADTTPAAPSTAPVPNATPTPQLQRTQPSQPPRSRLVVAQQGMYSEEIPISTLASVTWPVAVTENSMYTLPISVRIDSLSRGTGSTTAYVTFLYPQPGPEADRTPQRLYIGRGTRIEYAAHLVRHAYLPELKVSEVQFQNPLWGGEYEQKNLENGVRTLNTGQKIGAKLIFSGELPYDFYKLNLVLILSGRQYEAKLIVPPPVGSSV